MLRTVRVGLLIFGTLMFILVYNLLPRESNAVAPTVTKSTPIKSNRSPANLGQSSATAHGRHAKIRSYNSKTTDLQRHSVNQSREPEVRHIAFLKVHKAASTTLQTIFFRFGYTRNLSFALPLQKHYFSEITTHHYPLAPPRHGNHYDILCLHAFFNSTVYASVMPRDSVYLAVVRNPYRQFISAFHYYTKEYHFSYLTSIPDNAIENLIKSPHMYEKHPLSYTMNSMARDFGFQHQHFYSLSADKESSAEVNAYLEHLGKRFDFVLVAEYFDEGLILLKRLLRWKTKDILYIPKNVHSPEINVSHNLMNMFKVRNKLDYIVYDYFYRKFKRKLQEGGAELIEETYNFKSIVMKVQNWCADQYFGEMVVGATKWNERFKITSMDCSLMAMGELPFIKIIRGNFTQT